MCTTTRVNVNDRNAWVTFADAYPVQDEQRLIDLAAEVADLANPEGFPFGASVLPSSVDRSVMVVLHRVDPES